MYPKVITLLLALFAGGTMLAEYPEAFEEVSNKHELSGFDSLNKKERIIYTVWWLEAEVNNGGFHQYFWNSAGDHSSEALDSLKLVGAIQTASLLKSAIKIAFDGEVPKERSVRQKILEENEELIQNKLGKIDFEFYEYKENFYELINSYIATSET